VPHDLPSRVPGTSETLFQISQSTCNIIKDKFTGESRGFVEMPNKEEADKAIAALNGKDMKSRNLTVNGSTPK
jgi:RNA recognition motif-containing protein